jgi:hypothetical protein
VCPKTFSVELFGDASAGRIASMIEHESGCAVLHKRILLHAPQKNVISRSPSDAERDWKGQMKTCEKQNYSTEAHAKASMADLIERLQRQGTGDDWKILNVYECTCGYWHIGRSFKTRRKEARFREPKPATKKVPTIGELRRKLNRMQREWEDHDDRYARWRVEQIGRIVARDLLELAHAAEQDAINRFRVDDLLDSIQQAEHIAETIKPAWNTQRRLAFGVWRLEVFVGLFDRRIHHMGRIASGLFGTMLMILCLLAAALMAQGMYQQYWALPHLAARLGTAYRMPLAPTMIAARIIGWVIICMLGFGSYRLLKFSFRNCPR